jgi:hypothetical protein
MLARWTRVAAGCVRYHSGPDVLAVGHFIEPYTLSVSGNSEVHLLRTHGSKDGEYREVWGVLGIFDCPKA